MDIYFISGLGADRHAFDKLQLSASHVIHHIDWLEPLPKETLAHYAHRMSVSIQTEKPFVLIGLSFGGILCIEIAKFLKPQKIIIISSISCRQQLPWHFSLAGKMGLHKSGLTAVLKNTEMAMNWAFGVKSKKLKAYLHERIKHTSDNYLKWSLDSIIHWKQSSKPPNVIHIHGSADKLFLPDNVQADYMIARGSHFMVITHAAKISEIINKELDKLSA